MNNATYFPITSTLNRDMESIHRSLDDRALEIKNQAASQNIIKKITLIASKIFSQAALMVAAACLPVAAITLNFLPLTIAALSIVTAVACLALNMLLDSSKPGELIVKDHWKALFSALRKGDGAEIIHTCQALAQQKKQRGASFQRCLGNLPAENITPFFHKVRLAGCLLIAVEYLSKGNFDQAQFHAQLALNDFEQSKLSDLIKRFIRAIIDCPEEMHQLVTAQQAEKGLHTLDYLLYKKGN